MNSSPPEAPAVLILAAGRGTRMKSDLPKVLHKLMGRPLVEHVLAATLYLNPAKVVVVIGYGAEEVQAQLESFHAKLAAKREKVPELCFVTQTEQLGTGHAVAMARDVLADFTGPLLIMAGDVPLISPNTLDGFYKAHQALEADISVLTVSLADPAAYGRIIRDQNNWLEKIVEYRDATDAERLICEINSGLYFTKADELFRAISSLSQNNEQKEYYLTDVVENFRTRKLKAAAIEIPESLASEVAGVNDRYELANMQTVLKDRINASWLKAGVTMLDPLSTHIEVSVRLSSDVTLWPGVILTGDTTVGAGATVGPYTHLDNCQVAPLATVGAHRSLSGQKIEGERQNLDA